ncbi:RHS repeat-associated core domain-containing protein [Marispirochaeta sp.]|uniref:RHS repeat-associated core domain-containing protein n=1 Tax=Marispirochaeta sp. TaxID=2038653 RepID=UPI0029C914E5|nr:RHS repeat-associated core domain-containing protein [Marispirochaeta sp.]
MYIIKKKSIIACIFLLVSVTVSAEVIELIDGTRVWRQFASDEVLEYAKDPALRPGNKMSLSASALSLASTSGSGASQEGVYGSVPGTYEYQIEDGVFRNYGNLEVSPQSGTYRIDETDLVLPGLGGFDFSLKRRYDFFTAKDDQDTTNDLAEDYYIGNGSYSMGEGWRLELPYLNVLKNFADDPVNFTGNFSAYVSIGLSTGQRYKLSSLFYTEDSADPYVYENFYTTYFRVLYSPGASLPFRLVLADGTYYMFDIKGRVREIHGWADGHRADTITISYNSAGISTITNEDSGWTSTFTYSSGNISQIAVTTASDDAADMMISYSRDENGQLAGADVREDGATDLYREWSYTYAEETVNDYDADDGDEGTTTSIDMWYLDSATDPNGSVASIEGYAVEPFYDGDDYYERMLVTEVLNQEYVLNSFRARETVATRQVVYDYTYDASTNELPVYNDQTYIGEVTVTEADLILSDELKGNRLQTIYNFVGMYDDKGAFFSQLDTLLTKDPNDLNTAFQKEIDYDWDLTHRLAWRETTYGDQSNNRFEEEYLRDLYGNKVRIETYKESALGSDWGSKYISWTRYLGVAYPLDGSIYDADSSLYADEAAWKNPHPYYSTTLPSVVTSWEGLSDIEEYCIPLNLPLQRIVGNSVPQLDSSGTNVVFNANELDSYEYRHYAYAYDDDGFLIKSGVYGDVTSLVVLDNPVATAGWRTTALTYTADDSLNRLASVTASVAYGNTVSDEGGGGTTNYTYNDPAADGVYIITTEYSDPENSLNADDDDGNIVTSTGYDMLTLRPVWEMSGRGYVSEYERDVFGRVIRAVLPDVNEADDTPFSRPEDAGFDSFRSDNPVVEIEINDDDLWREVTDPEGRRTRTYYSSTGKKERVINYAADSGYDAITDMEYNGFGYPVRQTDPAPGIAGSFSDRPLTEYEYDVFGGLTEVINADDTTRQIENDYYNGLTITTDERGFVQKEYHSFDGTLLKTIEYSDRGATESRTRELYYDGLGYLRFEKDALGDITQYSYNTRGLLEQITYPTDEDVPFFENGDNPTETPDVYVQYIYDNNDHKIVEITETAGGEEAYTYYAVDSLGRVLEKYTSYTDVTLSQTDETSETVIAKTLYSYDADNNLISVVDARHSDETDPVKMSYTYSPLGQVIAQTDPEENTTTFIYHNDGKLDSKTDPRGQSENYPDFPGDFVTSYTYDGLGRLETESLPLAADGYTRPEVSYTYYPNGNLESQTTAEGAVRNYEYTERGRISSLEIEGGEHTYTTTYRYDDCGNEIQRVAPGGAVTSTEYDGLNRAMKVITPENTVRRYEYDAKDRVTAEYDGNGIATEYSYDAYGRTHTVTRAANSTRQDPETSTYWYDRRGNRTRMVDPVGRELQYTYDERGLQLTQYEVGLDKLYSFSYDEVGNMKQSRDPRGTVSAYEYDDNNRPVSVTMTNGIETKTITHTYDEAGFMYLANDDGIETAYNMRGGTYVPDPYGRIITETTTIGSESFEVGYDYNLDGRVTGVTSPSGQTTRYTYNPLGELLTVPGVIDTAVSYNAMGLHQNAILANGVTRSWEYDLNGRMTKKSDSGTSFSQEWRFIYDDADNILWKNDDYYEYDDVDRLTREVRSEDLVSVTGALPGYVQNDVVGNDALAFIDDTTTVKLDYNAGSVGADLGGVSTIERVTLSPTSVSHRVSNENIQVYTSTDNATYAEETEWQLRMREDGSLELAFDEAPEAQYIKIHCTYDERDADLEPVDESEFSNELGEMVDVFASTQIQTEESFTYDMAGNRQEETSIEGGLSEINSSSYYAAGQSHRLKTNGDSGANGRYAFVYDENGNMTARGTYYSIDGSGEVIIDTSTGDSRSYQWDLADRLTGASHREDGTLSGSVSYTYSPRGLRVTKTGTDGTTVFIYDQWGNVLYEKSGSEYRDYIRVFGSLLVRVDGTIDSDIHSETARYYYHTDHLGTIEAATDASGIEVWSANYSAFGEVLATTGSLDQEPVYTGKGYDDEVGLYYFNARWYDPELGRFISEDPAQDGVNWYVYVSNNPLKFVDPTGLDPHQNGRKPHEQPDVERQGDPDDDGDNDNGGSGNNTTGQTPTPEPEKKSAWEAFKDFFGGFFGGDDEEEKEQKEVLTVAIPGFPGDHPVDDVTVTSTGYRITTKDGWVVDVDAEGNVVGANEKGVSGNDISLVAGSVVLRAGIKVVDFVNRTKKTEIDLSSENPFKGKSPQEIDDFFRKSGFEIKGTDPVSGKGAYIDPSSGTKYYMDKGGLYRVPGRGLITEPPHVDIEVPGQPKVRSPL